MNLSDSQLGFRSCELALNSIFNSWKLSLDIKHNVITILLDFSKAFDTVDLFGQSSLFFKKFIYFICLSNNINAKFDKISCLVQKSSKNQI